jgi:glycogen operon protein
MKFVKKIIGFRKNHPVLHRRKFFQGRPIRGLEIKDIMWFKPDSYEMSDEEWNSNFARCLGMFLAGKGVQDVDEDVKTIRDVDILILFNADHNDIDFRIPDMNPDDKEWFLFVDTSNTTRTGKYKIGEIYKLTNRSIAIFTTEQEEE